MTTDEYIKELRKKFECPDGCNNFNTKKFTMDCLEDFLRKCLDQQKKMIIEGLPLDDIYNLPNDIHPVKLKDNKGLSAKYLSAVRSGYQQKTNELKDYIQSITPIL